MIINKEVEKETNELVHEFLVSLRGLEIAVDDNYYFHYPHTEYPTEDTPEMLQEAQEFGAQCSIVAISEDNIATVRDPRVGTDRQLPVNELVNYMLASKSMYQVADALSVEAGKPVIDVTGKTNAELYVYAAKDAAGCNLHPDNGCVYTLGPVLGVYTGEEYDDFWGNPASIVAMDDDAGTVTLQRHGKTVTVAACHVINTEAVIMDTFLMISRRDAIWDTFYTEARAADLFNRVIVPKQDVPRHFRAIE
jgi:hypothetical protein